MKTGRALLLIAFASIFLGLWISTIHWGDEKGFHGTGFPVAGVMWDKDSSGLMIDYPNPFASVMNMLAVFICLGLLFFLWKLGRAISAGFKKRRVGDSNS